MTTVIVNGGDDSAFAPFLFWGTDSKDVDAWLLCFEKYAVYRGISNADKMRLMAVLLQGAASDWYDNLDNGVKTDWTTLRNVFKLSFQDTKILRWRKASELWQRVQVPSESVDDYIAAVRKLAKSVRVVEE